MSNPKPCNNNILNPDTAACHIPYESICLARWIKQYDEKKHNKYPCLELIQMKSKPHKGSLAACTSSLFLLGMLI
jgi:hypothetical protein